MIIRLYSGLIMRWFLIMSIKLCMIILWLVFDIVHELTVAFCSVSSSEVETHGETLSKRFIDRFVLGSSFFIFGFRRLRRVEEFRSGLSQKPIFLATCCSGNRLRHSIVNLPFFSHSSPQFSALYGVLSFLTLLLSSMLELSSLNHFSHKRRCRGVF